MKFLNTYVIALMLLSVAITGCQKDDNFVVKQEAFSVITSGYNGSSNALDITIDTLTLKYPIDAINNFKRTDKYTFGDGQDSVKLTIAEQKTGKLVYEKIVKRGDYSVTIELIYVGGKLLEKPALPADKEGVRQVSYLFVPALSNYTGDVDIAYYKNYQIVANGELVTERAEELARITVKPYTFSAFLQAPIFPGGRTEIDGKIYFVNPEVKILKSGTTIPYYEDAGFTLRAGFFMPIPLSAKPQITGLVEFGTKETKNIEAFRQVQF